MLALVSHGRSGPVRPEQILKTPPLETFDVPAVK